MNQNQFVEYRAIQDDAQRLMTRIQGVLDRVPDTAYGPPPADPWADIQRIYGVRNPNIPEGYVRKVQNGDLVVRLAMVGEWVLGTDGTVYQATRPGDMERLILHPLPTQPVVTSPSVQGVYGGPAIPISERTPPKGYQFTGEFREPKMGEWFLNVTCQHAEDRVVAQWLSGPRLILVPMKVPLVSEPVKPTIQSVYGPGSHPPPAGYRFTGAFRKPRVGEWFLCRGGEMAAEFERDSDLSFSASYERLILEPLPAEPSLSDRIRGIYGSPGVCPPVGYQWKRDVGQRQLRVPQVDEWFLTTEGTALQCILVDVPRLILEPVPPTTPVLDIKGMYGQYLYQLKPPAGYVFKLQHNSVEATFRPPKCGEWFLSSWGFGAQQAMFDFVSESLLILEPSAAPTVESVYGQPLSALHPPAGWEFTGEMRLPKAEEHLMNTMGDCTLAYRDFTVLYRLILRRVPPVLTVEFVYGRPLADLRAPAGWRLTGQFRQPTPGESYLYESGFGYAIADFVFPKGPRLLLARAQRLVLDVVGEHAPAKAGDWVQYRATLPGAGSIFCAGREDNSLFDRILSAPRLEDVPKDAHE